MIDYIYDIETYPNIFCIGLRNTETGAHHLFEISWRKNEIRSFMTFLSVLRRDGDRMVGFNNVGFDYPVIHYIIQNQNNIDVFDIYMKADSIINTPWNQRFKNQVWDSDTLIPQIDLYKIHHFDNAAKATGLKVIEFNLKMNTIKDLPYRPGQVLDCDQCDQLIDYMWHDIEATELFYDETKSQIEFREQLTEKYNRSFINHNDTKIGKDYFVMQLEKLVPGFNKKNRTLRENGIRVADIIFPYIRFEQSEFNRILQWFNQQTITDTKGVFKDVSCNINGFDFVFGTGGIHGSVDPCIIESDKDYMIIDIDVASYYPNLAIVNRLYPEHLGEKFCDIYQDVYEQRKTFKKGTVENAMLKLALNGVYGDSNSKYSPFYDPQYTMSITINGQLLLCMLAEMLIKAPSVKLLQINTDGLTIKCPRNYEQWVKDACNWWEGFTRLQLEYAEYSSMFIRDVNNYIAQYTDGSIKRKGVYDYNLDWHQNHSALVVPKAVESHLVDGTDYRKFIENHTDYHDFMLRTKIPRSSSLVWVDYHGKDHKQQNVNRYYISMMGGDLVKLMPPTPTMIKNGKTDDRRIGINTGWKTTVCNDILEFHPDEIEHEWYIKEAEKLVKPLLKGGVI